MKWWAVGVSSFGYVLAIVGGVLLYLNAPPDLGTGVNIIPVEIDGFVFVSEEQMDKDRAQIDARQRRSRRGFLLVTIGAGLQLAGTLLAAFI